MHGETQKRNGHVCKSIFLMTKPVFGKKRRKTLEHFAFYQKHLERETFIVNCKCYYGKTWLINSTSIHWHL